MNYGLYLSASGVLTNLYRQDVFANNLANAQTPGFKLDLPTIRQREPESVEDQLGSEVSNHLLDQLGGGVLAGRQQISFAPSPMQKTGAPLDVAIESPDAFFAVSVQDPNTNASTTQLTRDGRFTRNPEGFLVTLAGGHRVLDTNNQPIRIEGNAPLSIDTTGRVLQAGQPEAQIQITGVSDLRRLVKQGQNLFGFEGGQDLRTPARSTTLRPEHVEASGVDPIKTLTSLIEATKAVTTNGNMIRYHDLLMDRAVNVLGRVE